MFVFNVLTFALGLLAGLLFVYYKDPDTKDKVIFPTPYNAGKVTYKDEAGTCFQYVATPVAAEPKNKALLKKQPIVI